MKECLVTHVDRWIVPHLEKKVKLEYIEQLETLDFPELERQRPLILGFEYAGDLSVLARSMDLLRLAAATNNLGKVVLLSSYTVYSPKNSPYREDDAVAPCNFAGIRAAFVENVLRYLYASFELDVTILRMFNPYGPFMSSPYVVASVLEGIAARKKLRIGDLQKTRDFLYVSDLVDLVYLVLEDERKGFRVFNAGSGIPTTIDSLVETAREVTGETCEVIFDAEKIRPEHDYDYVVADTNLVNEALDWKPSVDLTRGLSLTYQWVLGRRRNGV